MAEIRIDSKRVESLLGGLEEWARKGLSMELKPIADKLSKDYKERIRRGVGGDDSKIRAVKEVTMEMPVRFSTDKAIRKTVNSSRRALIARGNAVESIKGRRENPNRVAIQPTTQHGNAVFANNAKPRHNKVARDPLVVGNAQHDLVEKEIIASLDKIIGR